MQGKLILDACCGGRMFWFDRNHPDAIFQDIRKGVFTLFDGTTHTVDPDIVADFRNMPYPDNHFRLVVFDPPHIKSSANNSLMEIKYGSLNQSWQNDLKAGFNECMRVLAPYGILIFKWNERQVKLNQVLNAIGQQPLFGHVTGKQGKTIWCAFMKKPKTEI